MEKENMIKSTIFKQESESKKNMVRILKGCILSIITSVLLLLIFAILLTYTGISETTIIPVILIITGISVLAGSMISTRKIRKNGLINGGLVGFIYIIVLYIVSSLWLVKFSITLNSIIMIIIAVITGMIGGIIGVNVNKK